MQPQFNRYYTYIRPLARNKTFKTYSSLVFSLITITIFSIYAIKPTVSTIISLQKTIEEQKEVRRQLRTKIDNLVSIRNDYQKIDQADKDTLLELLPYSPSLPKISQSLSELVRASQATISGLQFQPVELESNPKVYSRKPAIKEVEFTINVQGDYPQLVNVLDSIRGLDRIIKINSVAINKLSESSMLLNINAKALYIKN